MLPQRSTVMPHMGAFHCHFRSFRQRVCATTPLSTQMYSLSFSLALPPLPPSLQEGGAVIRPPPPWCFQLSATVDRFAMQRYQLASDSSQFIQGSWKWLLLIYRLLGRCESDTRRRGQIQCGGGGWGWGGFKVCGNAAFVPLTYRIRRCGFKSLQ